MTSRVACFPMIGTTCFPKRHWRFSLVFVDHCPDLTAQKAFQSSVNVEIESPCFVTLPVYSLMYSASFCCALCFGREADPSVFSFFVRTRRPARLWPKDGKKPTQTFPSRRFDLSHPSFGRIRLRKAATETSDIEIDMLAESVSVLPEAVGRNRKAWSRSLP